MDWYYSPALTFSSHLFKTQNHKFHVDQTCFLSNCIQSAMKTHSTNLKHSENHLPDPILSSLLQDS